MRVFIVRAFENVPSCNAIMASVSDPPMEEVEVEFMSIPYEVEVDPAVENVVRVEEVTGVENAVVQSVSDVEVNAEPVEEVENDCVVEGNVEEDVVDEEEERRADMLYLEDIAVDCDVQGVQFTGLDALPDEASLELPPLPDADKSPALPDVKPVVQVCDGASSSCTTELPTVLAASENSSTREAPREKLGKGFRDTPDQALVKAGEGEERQKSHKNDMWSSRRADQLRSSLGWDMSIPLGDLDFKEMDLLLSDLFTRVVKVNGQDFPSDSLMNILGGFNRIMRRASLVRAAKGNTKAHDPLPKDFNIKHHFAFPRTRLVLKAAVQKSAKEGVNKKRVKVGTVTLEMEMALKLDHEHQITDSAGCQKRLVLYLVLRLGIRGGVELWNLKRDDLKLLTDPTGREFIAFEERESKNNSYSLDRTKEEQFRKTYYTSEEDFILTFKQYYRHLAPLLEGVKPDLFMQPINHPAGLIWYNKVTKVAERVLGQWLKNMMLLVGLPVDLITSNKAGRVTLITRMAACGVPDEIGCLVTGHHTTDGYGRYDRTKELKMEAAILVGRTPGLSYDKALKDVSKKFVQEQIIGSSAGLCPLMDKATAEKEADLRREMREQIEGSMGHLLVSENRLKRPLEEVSTPQRQVVQVIEPPSVQISPVLEERLTLQNRDYDQIDWEQELEKNPTLARALAKVSEKHFSSQLAENRLSTELAASHRDYDGINWELEMRRNPTLARHLGTRSSPVQAFSGNTFSNLTGCTIQICFGPSRENTDENKENTPVQQQQ